MITYTYTLPPELADLRIAPGVLLALPGGAWEGKPSLTLLVTSVEPSRHPARPRECWVRGRVSEDGLDGLGELMVVRVIVP